MYRGSEMENAFKRPYLRKTIKIRHVFIWIIFPVFPIIEIHTKPIKLQINVNITLWLG
jgi:hypothetical protein